MPSPFPGMDPYLEHPGSWPNVHHRLITAIADALAPQLLPKYQVLIEERVYQTLGADSILVGIPDAVVQRTPSVPESTVMSSSVAAPPVVQPLTVTLPMPERVRQGHLEIRDIATSEVVTVVEVLSPANKRPGDGRTQYEHKRLTILASSSHLVEIDLLRQWEPMPTLSHNIRSNYRILVSQSDRRPQADLYAFSLSDPIPSFSLPLRAADAAPLVNLQELLNGIYERSGYEFVIDYRRDPVPPPANDENVWIDQMLRQKGLR